MKNIVIVGSGGFAKEVAFLLEEINKTKSEWNILGYIDDNVGHYNGKYKVINNDKWLQNFSSELYVVFGVGFPELLDKLVTKFRSNNKLIFPNIIHPNVIADWDNIDMGIGNIICAGNIFTTDIKIGDFNVFNLDCTIGHDAQIGNYNIINPSVNISGNVTISNNILIGTGSQILQNLTIGNNIIIGAGAVVSKDIFDAGVYVGIPARKIK